MNNTFEWCRFWQVVKKDFRNIWSGQGSIMLFLVLLPAALWLFDLIRGMVYGITPDLTTATSPFRRGALIGTMCFFAAILSPSRLYGNCNRGKEGIYFAMLPASKLEKYLSMLLICLIVCPLTVLICNYLIDIFLTALPVGFYKSWIWTAYDEVFSPQSINIGWGPEGIEAAFVVASLLTALLGRIIFVFTNTIFKKHKVSKTILSLLLIGFVLMLVLMPTLMPLFVQRGEAISNWMREGNHLILFAWIVNAIIFLVCALLVWWSGYRLKKMPY